MTDFKKMNLSVLGHYAVLGLFLLVVAYLVMTIVSPALLSIGLISSALTFTDTLLLIILIKLFSS